MGSNPLPSPYKLGWVHIFMEHDPRPDIHDWYLDDGAIIGDINLVQGDFGSKGI